MLLLLARGLANLQMGKLDFLIPKKKMVMMLESRLLGSKHLKNQTLTVSLLGFRMLWIQG
jgi:hypothetical protein